LDGGDDAFIPQVIITALSRCAGCAGMTGPVLPDQYRNQLQTKACVIVQVAEHAKAAVHCAVFKGTPNSPAPAERASNQLLARPRAFGMELGTPPPGRQIKACPLPWRNPMLHYAVVFLVIAIIAAVLGFGGLAGTAVGIAKILFFVFLILFVLSLIFGRKKI
jgi:uncharacterized membrane protein YtjA (UPF0391 family)